METPHKIYSRHKRGQVLLSLQERILCLILFQHLYGDKPPHRSLSFIYSRNESFVLVELNRGGVLVL